MKRKKVQQVLERIDRASQPAKPRYVLAFRYNQGNYLDEMTMEFCSCTKLRMRPSSNRFNGVSLLCSVRHLHRYLVGRSIRKKKRLFARDLWIQCGFIDLGTIDQLGEDLNRSFESISWYHESLLLMSNTHR